MDPSLKTTEICFDPGQNCCRLWCSILVWVYKFDALNFDRSINLKINNPGILFRKYSSILRRLRETSCTLSHCFPYTKKWTLIDFYFITYAIFLDLLPSPLNNLLLVIHFARLSPFSLLPFTINYVVSLE